MEERDTTSVELEEQRVLLQVSGEDRVSFLHGMLSNDVSGLTPGGGAAALLLTEQGRIVAEMNLLVLDEEIRLDLTRAACDRLVPALERFIVADDVEFEERPGVAVGLRGAGGAAILNGCMEGAADGVGELAPGSHMSGVVAGMELWVARVDDLGGPAYRVWCPNLEAARALMEKFEVAGAAPLSPQAREILRIEAGVARAEVDFDEKTLAPEVPSLAHASSNRKGCYLGQEVVERVASRGKVKWLVASVQVEGACAPGTELEVEGKAVGHLTSVSPEPHDGKFAAIARVRREIFDAGQPMVVKAPQGNGEALPDPKPARV